MYKFLFEEWPGPMIYIIELTEEEETQLGIMSATIEIFENNVGVNEKKEEEIDLYNFALIRQNEIVDNIVISRGLAIECDDPEKNEGSKVKDKEKWQVTNLWYEGIKTDEELIKWVNRHYLHYTSLVKVTPVVTYRVEVISTTYGYTSSLVGEEKNY